MGGEGEERQAHLERVAVPATAGVLVGVVHDLGPEVQCVRAPAQREGHRVVLGGTVVVPAVVLLKLGPRCVLVLVAGAKRCLRQDRHAGPVIEVGVEHDVGGVGGVDEVGGLDGGGGEVGRGERGARPPGREAGGGLRRWRGAITARRWRFSMSVVEGGQPGVAQGWPGVVEGVNTTSTLTFT